MKKLIVLSVLLLFTAQGCKKDAFDDIITPVEKGENYKVYFSTPEELATWLNRELGRVEFYSSQFEELFKRGSKNLCYDSSDLLAFLAQYGVKAPDYIPVWNNFFQNASCGVAQWQYIGAERDETTGEGVDTEIIPDSVVWNIDGVEVTTFPDDAPQNENAGNLYFQTYTLDPETGEYVPNCGFFQPPCNGGHDATVTVYIDGAVYQRSAAGWAFVVNNVPDEYPFCAPYGFAYTEPSSTFDFDCGCPFVFDEYQFMIESGLEWDLDNDGAVASGDLLQLLSNYGC